MNQALVGVLSTLGILGSVGLMAQDKAPPRQAIHVHLADKGDKPKSSAPAAQPQTPPLSPEQQAALERAFNLPPGSEVEVDIVNRDLGSLRQRQEGRGVGAGAVAEGDKLDQQFNGTPPVVGLGADGSLSGSGGGAEADQRGSALKIPPLPWQNPLFWIGIALLAGTGGCVYLGLRRAALICGIGGVGCLASAFYPAILLFAVAGVLLAVFGPYLYAEFKKRKAEQDDEASWEALRAVVAGVEGKGVPAEARQAVKNAIAAQADARDKAVIDEVKRADSIGKYAD